MFLINAKFAFRGALLAPASSIHFKVKRALLELSLERKSELDLSRTNFSVRIQIVYSRRRLMMWSLRKVALLSQLMMEQQKKAQERKAYVRGFVRQGCG